MGKCTSRHLFRYGGLWDGLLSGELSKLVVKFVDARFHPFDLINKILCQTAAV